jgi:drug/metabolite transporter (DMT)-like permease
MENLNLVGSWLLSAFQTSNPNITSAEPKNSLGSLFGIQDWDTCIGMALLVGSMLAQAFMSSVQNDILAPEKNSAPQVSTSQQASLSSKEDQAPVNWAVLLFYSHFLALPFFIFFAPLITPAIDNASNHYSSNSLGLFNIYSLICAYGVSQLMCVSGVSQLKRFVTPLYLSILLNLRKVISVGASIAIFNHSFDFIKAVGGLLVFLGTVLYTRPGKQEKKKKKL